METIGILQGKQAKHNKAILKTLYDNGPRSIWQITGLLCSPVSSDMDFRVKNSLHKTLSKRIRNLEKKGYVAKLPNVSLWVLNFKGFMINLVMQQNYKRHGKEWDNLIDKIIEQTQLNLDLDWNATFNRVKKLTDEGVINWDHIKNITLATLIISEDTRSFLDILDVTEDKRSAILKDRLNDDL